MIRAASRLVAGTVLVLVNSATASAQAPAVAAPAPPTPLQAGFQDGFFIQTTTGDYRLLFGFVAQEDGRFVVDDPQHAAQVGHRRLEDGLPHVALVELGVTHQGDEARRRSVAEVQIEIAPGGGREQRCRGAEAD